MEFEEKPCYDLLVDPLRRALKKCNPSGVLQWRASSGASRSSPDRKLKAKRRAQPKARSKAQPKAKAKPKAATSLGADKASAMESKPKTPKSVEGIKTKPRSNQVKAGKAKDPSNKSSTAQKVTSKKPSAKSTKKRKADGDDGDASTQTPSPNKRPRTPTPPSAVPLHPDDDDTGSSTRTRAFIPRKCKQ